jgi:hypothetical protein
VTPGIPVADAGHSHVISKEDKRMDTTIRERRIPPAQLGVMLGNARLRRGYRLREAARIGGISAAHLCLLETGQRTPSRTMADVLVELLDLTDDEQEQLYAAAVDDAGRGHWKRQRAAAHPG